MNKQISVFIMDVSGSSFDPNFGEELEVYLHNLTNWIKNWSKDVLNVKVTTRMGDEIMLISESYAAAYMIASYISRIWKFKDHKPYFGLSFGNIQRDLEDINLETWIHPLVKQARIANDELKKVKDNRPLFRFKLDNNVTNTTLINLLNTEPSGNLFSVFETLINTLIETQNLYFIRQTELQELITTLYLILGKQRDISSLIKKSPSTISSHLNKGDGFEVIKTFQKTIEALVSFQVTTLRLEVITASQEDSEIDSILRQHNPYEKMKRLDNQIKKHIKDNIHSFFDLTTS
jgi:hypothetical protein